CRLDRFLDSVNHWAGSADIQSYPFGRVIGFDRVDADLCARIVGITRVDHDLASASRPRLLQRAPPSVLPAPPALRVIGPRAVHTELVELRPRETGLTVNIDLNGFKNLRRQTYVVAVGDRDIDIDQERFPQDVGPGGFIGQELDGPCQNVIG